MATIPGLQALDDVANRGQPFAGRPVPQGGGADTPQLNPVATPVDTFIHAAQPVTNAPELGRIADALSAFQPELAQFSQTQKLLQNQQAEGRVPQLLAGQTADDMRGTLKSNPQLQSVAAQRLGMSMLGASQANETFSKMQQEFSTNFDKEHGDFNQFVNGFMQQDLKANPDPFFAKSYASHMGSAVEALRQHYTQLQAGFQKDTQDNLIDGTVTSAINTGLLQKTSAADVYKGIQTTFGTIKTIAGRPYAEQQQLLLGALEKQSITLPMSPDYEKRFEMIRGLITQDRGTQNGVAIGSMLDSPTLGGRAAQILEHATQAYENRFEVQNQDVLGSLGHAASTADPSYPMRRDQLIQEHPLMVRGGAIQRLDRAWDMAKDRAAVSLQKTQLQQAADREQNSYLTDHVLPSLGSGTAYAGGLQDATIHNAKGEEVSYTVDQQIKDGVAAMSDRIDRTYKPDDPRNFQAKLELYVGNGVKNKAWTQTLNAGFASAQAAVASGEKTTMTPALQAGYDLYKKLDAASPAALTSHAEGKAEMLYSMASAAEQAGLSTTQALATAVKATQDKEFMKNLPSLSMTETKDDIHRALMSNKPGLLGIHNPFAYDLSNVSNASEVEARVHQLATVIHGAYGLPLKDAIQTAADRISKQYQVINGSAVNVSGREVPQNFADLSQGVIDNWWTDHGAQEAKEGHSKSDLSLQQIGNTPQWVMLYKSSHTQPSSPHAAFGLPELYGVANQRSNEARTNLGKANDNGNQGRNLRDLLGGATGPM